MHVSELHLRNSASVSLLAIADQTFWIGDQYLFLLPEIREVLTQG
jgi:hypothetical protein